MKRLMLVIALLIVTGVLAYFITEKSSEVGYVSLFSHQLSKRYFGQEDKEMFSPISIEYLRSLDYEANPISIEEELEGGSNYKKYIASYMSDSNKVYGLLTIPEGPMPKGGYSAIVFNHGYIPPEEYSTTENYATYVDYIAKEGFVVFKIDFRGHGDSEGVPSGGYFSSAYTVDAINALLALQDFAFVNPEKIGMWGHSMSGNLVLRSMLITNEIKAGVIWSGAIYSYKDFVDYGINDPSYIAPKETPIEAASESEYLEKISMLRDNPEEIDFESNFWSALSLTKNLEYLEAPLQLHHSIDDPVVNIEYSRNLADILEENNKRYEIYEYAGGGHNINSPYFEAAMKRTVDFFKLNLN